MQNILLSLEIAIARSKRRLDTLKSIHIQAPRTPAEIIKPIKDVLPILYADIMMDSDYFSDAYKSKAQAELKKHIQHIEKILPELSHYPSYYHKLYDVYEILLKAIDVYDYISAYGKLNKLGEELCI